MESSSDKPSLSKEEGIALIIAAPSGTGKTTVCHRLMEKMPNLKFSVSLTTRSPRVGEVDGEDYFFVSETTFNNKKERGDFLEWAKVHNNFYGTDRGHVQNLIDQGQDLILELDIQGVESLRQQKFPAVLIFILPPSITELSFRLQNRSTETDDKIEQRIETGKKEIKSYHLFDYVLTNHDVEDTVDNILAIIKAEKCRTSRFSPASQEILDLLNSEA